MSDGSIFVISARVRSGDGNGSCQSQARFQPEAGQHAGMVNAILKLHKLIAAIVAQLIELCPQRDRIEQPVFRHAARFVFIEFIPAGRGRCFRERGLQ